MSEEMVKGGEILLYQNGAEKEVVNVVSKCLPSAST